jgi:serine/threonine protein kinase
MAEKTPNGAPPGAVTPGTTLPPLGDLAYRAQRFLLTDSKMSEILVVRDDHGRDLVFKIACVRHRSRTQANRQAIVNSVTWLETLGRHPGIVTLHPIARRGAASDQTPIYMATLRDCPGQPEFIVLDYMAGGALSDFVRKRPLPLKVAAWLTYRVADTLAHLHSRGCVHRDLKPENILFAQPPRTAKTLPALQPLLIDFGVAAGAGDRRGVCGSRLWMAPELQEADEQQLLPVDPSWDIYALGLIGCYLLSGQRPRRGAYSRADYLDYQQTAFTQGQAALTDQGSAAQPLFDAFTALLAAMLAPNASERPTATAIVTTLAPLVADNQHRSTPPTPMQKAPPRKKTPHQPPADAARAQPVAPVTTNPAAPAVAHSWWPIRLSRGTLLSGVAVLALLLLLPTLFGGGANSESAPAAATLAANAAIVVDAPATATATAVSPTATSVQVTEGAPVNSVPPTLAAIPTLAALAPPATAVAPTLAALPANAIAEPPPTLAPLPATATPTSTPLPTPTRTATRRPAPSPTATVAAPIPAAIQLIAPPADTVSNADRVTFRWVNNAPLPETQCYELVFWDPTNSSDQRSPVGAGRDTQRTVNLRALLDSTDPLLRRLAGSNASFAWGVRVVDCAAPRTIIQGTGAVRQYHFQP